MQIVKISDLKPHPKNDYFFDDMEGQKFKELKESIRIREEKEKDSGVIEPIVITQDKVIVSGHQRVRACKELGITSIKAEVKLYDNEDAVILDLIEANIRQRGTVGGSQQKLGRRWEELCRINGVREGSAGKVGTNNVRSKNNKSREEIAQELGYSVKTLENAKKFANLSPEIQELVENDTITSSTAIRVINTKIKDKEEQKKFAQTIIGDRKYTQKQMDEEVHKWKVKVSQLTQEKDEIARSKVKVEEKIVEVDKPETLDRVNELEEKLKKSNEKNQNLTKQIFEQNEIVGEVLGTMDHKLVSDCTNNSVKMMNFLKEMSPYDYMAESLCNLPPAVKNEYVRCISGINRWSSNILKVIDEQNNVVDVIDDSFGDESKGNFDAVFEESLSKMNF